MRTYKAKAGPLSERPFFALDDIERICLDELEASGLLPSEPSPVRIDRFIEKKFGVSVAYEDLPAGVLGFTRFGPKGVEAVVVSRQLDDEGTKQAERRLRTTLAHEAGHGLLHAHLFALADSPVSLFDEPGAVDQRRILCRDGGISGLNAAKRAGYDGRWWEFQANQAMGALLLPKRLVETGIRDLLIEEGLLGRLALPEENREKAVRQISEIFDVNQIVSRLRLNGIYPNSPERQMAL